MCIYKGIYVEGLEFMVVTEQYLISSSEASVCSYTGVQVEGLQFMAVTLLATLNPKP